MKRNVRHLDDIITALCDVIGAMDEPTFDPKKGNAVCAATNSIIRALHTKLAVHSAAGLTPGLDLLAFKPSPIDVGPKSRKILPMKGVKAIQNQK